MLTICCNEFFKYVCRYALIVLCFKVREVDCRMTLMKKDVQVIVTNLGARKLKKDKQVHLRKVLNM